MESNDLRNSFFHFFRNKNHQIVSSAPMVIKGDPTLMFTNAGMNQFKDIFTGITPVKHPRVANTQKCLRVSGKHNDLEEVGIDTYHHTMFEMLGNWSFGDPAHPAGGYFKKEAISWAWEFLTSLLKIDKTKLYATVFEGSKEDKTVWDEEAYDYWKAYLPKDRILKGNKKDNFWEMGDTGPCGPCSEIHIDLRDESERKKIPGKDLVNKDHPQVIEIWNLVFIQFNRKTGGSLEALPQKHVDTGMGFERLCMVMQQKKSNYDTDIFQPIISKTSELCGKSYGDDPKTNIAMRVIADHIRAISFSIADGQLPSNNRAGYVIRRILRRAVRYGFTFLGLKEPFLFQLVPVLVHKMGDPFPELKAQQSLIEKVVKEEEISFLKTLETGIRLLEQIIENTRSQNYNVVNGKMAFELYDTYGFPLDLTELILKENDLVVNRKEFEEEMKKQKDRSRNAGTMEAGDWIELRADDEEEFIGYERTEADVYITRYRKIKRKGKEHYQLVFNITPFYAESGGQVGDTGTLTNEEESIAIIDTQKENNLIVHFTKGLPKNPGAKFRAIVEREKRKLTANNHTATHLLHHALRKVLGNHVEQKGSLVSPDHLRFDFSHFQKMTEEDIRQVETFVNEEIRNNYILDERRNIPMDEAKDLGAIALFGEKYGDLVRVIKFGDSTELCGGTHVQATGQIGSFKIVSESAIAAGIRRIEAITAEKAEKYIHEQLDILNEIKQTIKGSKNLMDSIHGLIKENAALSKQLEKFGKEALKIAKHNLKSRVIEINGIQVIAEKVELESADALKDLSFQLRNEIENLFLILGMETDGKASLSIMISDNLVKEKGLHAGNIIREIAREIQGGGGGQPFFATAGGKKPEKIEDALAKAKQMLEKV